MLRFADPNLLFTELPVLRSHQLDWRGLALVDTDMEIPIINPTFSWNLLVSFCGSPFFSNQKMANLGIILRGLEV